MTDATEQQNVKGCCSQVVLGRKAELGLWLGYNCPADDIKLISREKKIRRSKATG